MWCWRRMLRIPWNAFRTNKAILEELGITQRLSSIEQARILTFFGHVSRREEATTPLNVWWSKEESRAPDHAEDRP
ncbi:jg15940 [Pararge aegeria aegeria]|uniref:Jg15940 protein n=1 Tax=Pararge aegeria aegeria TaxID=348720 RepID=A0A8S4RZL7_9NEOP|nr:jg15940 [Pararge aegeria aegeria]